MTIDHKFEAAISDTDILIDLYKSDCFDILTLLFNKIYIPEYIYINELEKVVNRDRSISLNDVKSKIEDESSPFEIVYESDLDIITKNAKKAMVNEKIQLADRGEVECASYARVTGINFVVSNNHTEFKHLNDIAIMLNYYHILSICVFHNKIDEDKAQDLYERVNSIKTHSSSHSFNQKLDKSWDYFCESEYLEVLKLTHC